MKIKTGKGELPIRYSWNTLRKIGDELNMTMNDVLELDLTNRSISDTFVFVFEGFKEGARLEKEECKVNDLDDIGDLLTDDPGILQECFVAFGEDMKMMNKAEGDKKK